MKISYLGIDNTYKDGAISAGAYTTDPRLIAKLDFATEALRKWAAKYPNDPQLARSYFLGVITLRKVYTQGEQQTAWEFTQILIKKYGNTYFGKTMKSTVAQGYTEHWFALAQLCPTPLPAGVMPETTPVATPSGVAGSGPSGDRNHYATMRATVAASDRHARGLCEFSTGSETVAITKAPAYLQGLSCLRVVAREAYQWLIFRPIPAYGPLSENPIGAAS